MSVFIRTWLDELGNDVFDAEAVRKLVSKYQPPTVIMAYHVPAQEEEEVDGSGGRSSIPVPEVSSPWPD